MNPSDSYDMPDADPDTEIKSGAVWVDPDLAACPVIPLGFSGAHVHFALPEGELRKEPASKIAGMLKTDLFVSVAGRTFLANWRDQEGKLQRDMCAQWFVDQCRRKGRWDENRPERGLGVWATGDGIVVHAGDALGRWPFKEGDWTPVADALRAMGSGPVWLLRPPAPRPGKPASVADGDQLRALLDMWQFAPLGEGLSEADVVLGWQGVALLGEAPRFRPHISVSGGAGTGKTTLSRLMQAAGSANAGELLDQFTDAGIRNSLSAEARALYLDEAEPSPDGQGPVERVMEVLRRMSTGDGSCGRKGDIGGKSVNTSAVGAGWLASIFPVAIGDAMATRMVEVRLRPLGKAKGGADDELKAAMEWAREASPRFLARAIRDVDRFRADASLIKTALGEGGKLPRTADLIAALAAGRRLLLADTPLTLETARDEVRLWAALIQGREESSAAQNAGQACFSKIMTLSSGQHRTDRHLTVGELVFEELERPSTHDKVLKHLGLKVENGWTSAERVGPWLVISTNHPWLARNLAGTSFANWAGVLRHLDDLGEDYAPRSVPKAVRFAHHQSRALAVPLTPWLEKPVAVGADPTGVTPFDEPKWVRPSPDSSRPASHGETHD